MWIVFFDQFDLPFTLPKFQRFFPFDGISNVVEYFKVDKVPHVVSFGKAFRFSGFVLIYSLDQIRRYAEIQRAIRFTG